MNEVTQSTTRSAPEAIFLDCKDGAAAGWFLRRQSDTNVRYVREDLCDRPEQLTGPPQAPGWYWLVDEGNAKLRLVYNGRGRLAQRLVSETRAISHTRSAAQEMPVSDIVGTWFGPLGPPAVSTVLAMSPAERLVAELLMDYPKVGQELQHPRLIELLEGWNGYANIRGKFGRGAMTRLELHCRVGGAHVPLTVNGNFDLKGENREVFLAWMDGHYTRLFGARA